MKNSKLKYIAFGIAALVGLGLQLEAKNPNPYLKADEDWITINGTVVSTSPDSFELDYGKGIVTVEMDDWDMDADGYKVFDGDKVTVNGRVDRDLFETTSIEAASVFVEGLNTYFFASAADEENATHVHLSPVVLSVVKISGKVTDVDGRAFTLKSGDVELRVDTDEMGYNPLDNHGFQQVDVGDRVKVSGHMDYNFFTGQELQADYVLTLKNNYDDNS